MAVKVLFVCHAGAGTGLGHLVRSLVAARALRDEPGFDVQFLVQGDIVDRPDLKSFEHRFIPFGCDFSDALLQQVTADKTGIVVFDVHDRHVPSGMESLLTELRCLGCRLVTIDALAFLYEYLDLVYVPSFRFTPPDGADPKRFLYGWDHYLLNVSASPVTWKPGRAALVLTGGSDATALGETLPALLDRSLPPETELHWVVGPFAAEPILPDPARLTIVVHKELAHLDKLMVRVNYAITVYGVSFFELLQCGIPTVVFSPYGTKDDVELASIASEGVALVAENEFDAVGKLKLLMDDDALAANLSLQAKRKLPSGAPHKFAQALQDLMLPLCRRDI
jgi:spore coat polysaccharide biosynthesis predicted glycosyltransferase SpsG